MQAIETKPHARSVKCVVWDLDDTLWDGVLLEDPGVSLRPGVRRVIEELDERGILQSVASKNEPEKALAKLREVGLCDYFLYPQIGWNPKSASVQAIARELNIALDALAFVDDSPFERDEVAFAHDGVLCIDSADPEALLDMPELNPRFITEDSKRRRVMYLSDFRRKREEQAFEGTNEEFLRGLGMRVCISEAGPGDLARAEELTLRTHQLNTTGYSYSYEELDRFRSSPDHLLLIVGMDDRYGTYGKIGLALVALEETTWTIKLLLMSCRVMSRGVGGILVTYLRRLARERGVRLRAEFRETPVNRLMYVTYRFAQFVEAARDGDNVLLEQSGDAAPFFPDYVEIELPVSAPAAHPERGNPA